MNLSEFKAWFDGFTENLDGAPNERAWKKIQAKVKEIKDAPATSYPVYIDRWVRPYWNQYWGPYYGAYASSSLGALQGSALGMQCMNNSNAQQALSNYSGANSDYANWNAQDAFRDLGRAEAAADAA